VVVEGGSQQDQGGALSSMHNRVSYYCSSIAWEIDVSDICNAGAIRAPSQLTIEVDIGTTCRANVQSRSADKEHGETCD